MSNPNLKSLKEGRFLNFIQKNLDATLKKETQNTLGDRQKYIGASDIGGCPFNVVMSKKHNLQHDMRQHIIFQRGHLAEDLVSKMLSGLNTTEQYEATGSLEDSNIPLKAHIDKLVKSKDRFVIIEVKTVSTPIDEPYESWVLQVQFQMGLLKQSCKQHIEGYILALDLNTGWHKPFYIEFNPTLYKISLEKAQHIADAMEGKTTPEAHIQGYCSMCKFKTQCPKNSSFSNSIPSDLKADVDFIKNAKKIEKEKKSRENKIKNYLVNMGINKIKDNDTVISIKEQEFVKLDSSSFKEAYPELYVEFCKTNSYYKMNIL